MAMTPSTMMLGLGTPLPSFQLHDIDGNLVSTDQFHDAPALLIVFICPHCPFVRHIRRAWGQFAREYQSRGLAIIGVNSNDNIAFPDDSPEGMRKEIADGGYPFPYLVDETQNVAKAFRAACTPDFFLFDRDRRLVYRGQFDDSRPSNSIPTSGADLRAAADAVLEGRTPSTVQKPSIGCNIKWKAGNAPEYFAAEVWSR